MKDNHSNFKVVRAISPQTQTNSDTAIEGEIIDVSGYNSAEFFIAYGAMTDSDATVTVLLQESDNSDLSSPSSVSDDDLLGTEAEAGAAAATDDNTVKKLGYKGGKRYIKLTLTPSGNNSGALPVSAVCVLEGKVQPTS